MSLILAIVSLIALFKGHLLLAAGVAFLMVVTK